MNKKIEAEHVAEGYEKWLYNLAKIPEFISKPRNLLVHENLFMSINIRNIDNETWENEVRSPNFHYLAGELLWYFSGRNDLEFIEKYSKFWKNIANKDNTLNSAYGNLIFKRKPSQWEWAKNSLINDKHSRQAIMHFNGLEHQFENNKDFVCTMYYHFFIRGIYLYASVYMRSSDAILGVTYDWPFFILLQKLMYKELEPYYPDLRLGSFIFNTGSAHLYDKHIELAKEMLKKDFKLKKLPEINPSIILNSDLNNIKSYNGNDEFMKWLKENA